MQFIDLEAQQRRIKDKLDARFQAVLSHGKYIMGPEVSELEEKLTAFCGAKHCISCANGTDALQLALMAFGIRTGDAVFVPSFTFASTIEVVPCMGATPILVDIDPRTFNMDPESLKRAIIVAKKQGLRPAVVIPVDLFGLPSNYPVINAIAAENDMKVIADSAQGFGGTINGQMTGTFGDITTTSFFPAKPLGCYGDGGALFTDNDELAELLDSMRVHGKGSEKYDNVRIGMNSRLDTLQAAILLEKLAIYADEIVNRQRAAEMYKDGIADRFVTPLVPNGYTSVWAQYTLKANSTEKRSYVMEKLKGKGVPTMIYYPRPLHAQTAYNNCLRDPQGLRNSEIAAATVFSLPMHGYLQRGTVKFVITTLVEVSESIASC